MSGVCLHACHPPGFPDRHRTYRFRGPPLSFLVEYGPLGQKISSQALGPELLFCAISLWTGFPIYLSFDKFVDSD